MKHDTNHSPDILDPEEILDFFRFCRVCRLESKTVIAMVEEGVVEPDGQSVEDWKFTFSSVSRVQKARRLQQDFELNLPGVALSIDLLDEIEELRQEIDLLKRRLGTT